MNKFENITKANSISKHTKKPESGHSIASSAQNQQETEIPRFDLTEEIMAEQRKITAMRRKGPYNSNLHSARLNSQPADYKPAQAKISIAEDKEVIAEIVARDIDRLCCTNSPLL